ncbi:unnamed protein product [Peronospora belbahrii]|uniref:Uncharacterized protein n=1 Tax=Peronospora belbahrii TaxID=622444 RepID=A0ABN8CP91_9STRA|nr:unnamed protein product [Peronospora belbahrii]
MVSAVDAMHSLQTKSLLLNNSKLRVRHARWSSRSPEQLPVVIHNQTMLFFHTAVSVDPISSLA